MGGDPSQLLKYNTICDACQTVPNVPIHICEPGASLKWEQILVPNTSVLVSKDCLKSMQRNVQLYESFYLGRLIGQVNSIPKTSNKIKANTNINVVMLDNPN